MFQTPQISTRKEPKFVNKDVSDVLAQIDDYDKKMLAYLIELNNSLGRDIINIDQFEDVISALQYINTENQYDYLNSLLHPERCKGVKIPSPIPVPSCAFQLHNSVTLTTNSSGNFVFIFNPFFLCNNTLYGQKVDLTSIIGGSDTISYIGNQSSFFFNNSDEIDGRTAGVGSWNLIDIGQSIPNVYNQYRLVSASLIVKYIGRMDITSGVIGGAVVFDEGIFPGYNFSSLEPPPPNPEGLCIPFNSLKKYTNFDLAYDSFYYQENQSIEGIREIYFPLDNTYEEYTKACSNVQDFGKQSPTASNQYLMPSFQGTGKCGFQQLVYVMGAPARSPCFKVDIYCNFETLPNAEFLNYMPISLSPKNIDPHIKKETMAIVQKNPITIAKDTGSWYGNIQKKLFSGLKKVWNSGIPRKALDVLSPFILPYFKPAIALTNMIASGKRGDVNNSFSERNKNVLQMIDNAESVD